MATAGCLLRLLFDVVMDYQSILEVFVATSTVYGWVVSNFYGVDFGFAVP